MKNSSETKPKFLAMSLKAEPAMSEALPLHKYVSCALIGIPHNKALQKIGLI
jgi:hypothetical protein